MSKKNFAKLALGAAIQIKINPIFSSRVSNIIDRTFSFAITVAISSLVSDYMIETISKELKKAENVEEE